MTTRLTAEQIAMGPIERELRRRFDWVDDRSEWLSYKAFCVLMDAEESLGVSGPLRYSGKTKEAIDELHALWPDIWSEAIEAAEALKL